MAVSRDDARQSTLMANTRICINDLVSSYKGNGAEATIDDYRFCVQAKADGASITYIGDNINVANVDASLNGDDPFKGTLVIY